MINSRQRRCEKLHWRPADESTYTKDAFWKILKNVNVIFLTVIIFKIFRNCTVLAMRNWNCFSLEVFEIFSWLNMPISTGTNQTGSSWSIKVLKILFCITVSNLKYFQNLSMNLKDYDAFKRLRVSNFALNYFNQQSPEFFLLFSTLLLLIYFLRQQP